MEALSRLILKAWEGGFISGLKVKGRRRWGVRRFLISFLPMTLLFFVRPLKNKSLSSVGCFSGLKLCRD